MVAGWVGVDDHRGGDVLLHWAAAEFTCQHGLVRALPLDHLPQGIGRLIRPRLNETVSSISIGEPLIELPEEVVQDLSWDQQTPTGW